MDYDIVQKLGFFYFGRDIYGFFASKRWFLCFKHDLFIDYHSIWLFYITSANCSTYRISFPHTNVMCPKFRIWKLLINSTITFTFDPSSLRSLQASVRTTSLSKFPTKRCVGNWIFDRSYSGGSLLPYTYRFFFSPQSNLENLSVLIICLICSKFFTLEPEGNLAK